MMYKCDCQTYNTKKKEMAYTAVVTDSSSIIGLAVKGEKGYYPTPLLGSNPHHPTVQLIADELNRKMFNLEPKEALIIVASTM